VAGEPCCDDVTWISEYAIGPFYPPRPLLADYSNRPLQAKRVADVTAQVSSVKECKFYASSESTSMAQQGIQISPNIEASAVDAETRRSDPTASCRTGSLAWLGLAGGGRRTTDVPALRRTELSDATGCVVLVTEILPFDNPDAAHS